MSATPPPGLASRRCALHVLSAVLDSAKPLDEALEGSTTYLKLAPADRAFVQLLVRTTLKRLGQCDALLARWLTKPLPRKAVMAMHILRLGVAQILFLDVPAHAAVHTAVEIAKLEELAPQAGLINALLNRTVREGADIIVTQDWAKLNTPGWLWRSWVKAYGEEQARAIVRANLETPALDLTVKDNPAQWAEKFGGEAVGGNTVRLIEWQDVTALPGYAEGAWWVQDISAALPARMLLEKLGDARGKKIIDFCAAPGGKTMQLASSGADVTAVDTSARRMERVHENLKRTRLKADCVVSDALKYTPAFTPDAILLDAPCSATGTLRRHPDIATLRKPAEVARLAALQQKLLDHALSLLAPGGVLVYAVCSIQPEEGVSHLEALRSAGKADILTSLNTVVSGIKGDGFFVVLISKR